MLVQSLVKDHPNLLQLRFQADEAAFHFKVGQRYSHAVITELYPKLPIRPTDIRSPNNLVPTPVMILEKDFARLPLRDRANQVAVWYFSSQTDYEKFIELAGVKTH